MKELFSRLSENPIIYITRDIERAIGLEFDTPGYFIISNSTNFAKSLADNHTNIVLIEDDKILDTWELLERVDRDFLSNLVGSNNEIQVAVFKSTPKIERICQEKDFKLLNPDAKLSNTIEEKISQVEWLDELSELLPEHSIQLCKNLDWKDRPFILQFNRAHTGSGTILIKSQEQLNKIKLDFPERPARLTKYIKGPVFTSNNIVFEDKILMGNISYQITGLSPFTDQEFATVGNDFALPSKILNREKQKEFEEIVNKIGKKLQKQNWKGLFGVDIVLDQAENKLFLIEINARQPASTVFESSLQKDAKSITNFEAHLASLLGIKAEENQLTEIKNGAQLVQRIINKNQLDNFNTIKKEVISKLKEKKLKIFNYPNKKNGSDLLRIQSSQSLMKKEDELNELGKEIVEILKLENDSQENNMKTLSEEAKKTINSFFNLKIAKNTVKTPYFNNQYSKVRAGLRVLIGKGSATEIEEEAKIISLKQKINLEDLSEENARKFLTDNNLGIDCSGFAFYVLEAEVKAKLKGNLSKSIRFEKASFARKLIRKIRTIENINVQTLTLDSNSKKISLKNIKPGDFIITLKSGSKSDRDHIVVIEKIVYQDQVPKTIHYAHSLQWSTDILDEHGVRRGKIEIIDIEKSITEQNWIEQEKTNQQNETFTRFRDGKETEIRRLNVL